MFHIVKTDEAIEKITNGFVTLRCSDYETGVTRNVVTRIMNALIELKHPKRTDVLLEFVRHADCHNCEFLCSFIPKVTLPITRF